MFVPHGWESFSNLSLLVRWLDLFLRTKKYARTKQPKRDESLSTNGIRVSRLEPEQRGGDQPNGVPVSVPRGRILDRWEGRSGSLGCGAWHPPMSAPVWGAGCIQGVLKSPGARSVCLKSEGVLPPGGSFPLPPPTPPHGVCPRPGRPTGVPPREGRSPRTPRRWR